MFRTLIALAATLSSPLAAHAFCGFYVSGADASLYSSATMVVMMRHENNTVLSMQNNYQGPPEDFAMVVPVPVVLSEETVKTLPREVFDRVDRLAAPRLVEYWETDPCSPNQGVLGILRGMTGSWNSPASPYGAGGADLGVTVEAEFSVAEYDIVILSAEDSSGLDTWLRRESYNIPEGAEGALRPYVEAGTKFFVAKVAADRVTFADGRAVLSPLRFHYETDSFELPVRLGLLNSAGQQDLLVHVLASKRYEVANYPNATIPTNIVVEDQTRWGFADFYDLLFRRTVAQHEGAVVTEYSWAANSCDPCPVPALTPEEIATLGGDVTGISAFDAVLTRLHHRYTSQGLSEDLVFREADPIIGGRGTPDREGKMDEESAAPANTTAIGRPANNFQGRYVILHRWEGEIECEDPQRGFWGGPPGRAMPIWGAPAPLLREAEAPPDPPEGLAAVTAIGLLSKVDVPAIGVRAGRAETPHPRDPGAPGQAPTPVEAPAEATMEATMEAMQSTEANTREESGGCGSCTAGGPVSLLLALPLLLLRRRR